jgi:beta-phosphoglucomutase-like phosphatase (HAD superfamily)
MTELHPIQASDLHYRIWSEFLEMPGLRLTLEQACRLCGFDRPTGVRILQDLVDAAVLRQVGPHYIRADLGRFSA